MKTSFDYTPYLPQTAPDYLKAWAEQRKYCANSLIWKVGSWREPLTGLKQRCARVTCTACGETYLLDYEPGGACHGSGYPPRLRLNNRVIHERELVICPECGAEACAEHIHGSGEYAGEYIWPVTFDRIQLKGKTDRLCVVLWKIFKYHAEDGGRQISIRPYEAYIVEEKSIVRCSKHAGFMYSVYETEWRQTVRFTDTLKDICEAVCPEGIAKATQGTTAENSKLEIYMKDKGVCFPVSWLRIWQKHPNAETLMTCGAAEIVSNLIGQEKAETRRGYREEYGTAIPLLKEIDWKEKRPSRMLHMNRGELREAVKLQKGEALGGKTWDAWLFARKSGHRWDVSELSAIEGLERKDLLADCAETPSRILHYLEVQKRRKKKKPEESTLFDYWRMARNRHMDLSNPEIRWPEDLHRAHDRLVAMKKEEENKALSEKIAQRALKLKAYEYHSGGIFIRPPETHGEFINEGNELHHCVESYARSHADGRTTILFIRRESEPDKPFFTLELNIRACTVRQNRGNRNCERTKEVKEFETEWLAWVKAGCPATIMKEGKTA